MLAPPQDFGYSPSAAQSAAPMYSTLQAAERPKLFLVDPSAAASAPMALGGTPMGAAAPTPAHAHMYHQHMAQAQLQAQGAAQGAALLAQHHEPLLYYAPPTMNDYQVYAPGGAVVTPHSGMNGSVTTPSSTCKPGSKRSREDLNLKEKKRMFKLNDRINQLKSVLDEAGVQTKKNKQSILDNAAHYIDMLRSNLVIAKQKVERAEKQAEAFKAQARRLQSSSNADKLVTRSCFHATPTPRVLLDAKAQTLVACNAAFASRSGASDTDAALQQPFAPFLCLDQARLDQLVQHAARLKKTASAVVQAQSQAGTSEQVLLVVAAVTDDAGRATHVEASVLPVAEQLEEAAEPKEAEQEVVKQEATPVAETAEEAETSSEETEEPKDKAEDVAL